MTDTTEKKLTKYRSMRKFRETPEPAGRPQTSKERNLQFIIQKHDATRLHYDFRLEIGGVLKSWAVPKGPSLNPADKRLAVPTEDHPIEYGGFEGNIPEGNYGAGAVILWDRGKYRNLRDRPMEECAREGHIKIWLEGSKVRGGFSLRRTGIEGARDKWLLVKVRDEEARDSDITQDEPKSVVSGLTVEEMAHHG